MKLYGGYIDHGAVRRTYRRAVVLAVETLAGMAAVSGVFALGGLLCRAVGAG